MTARRPVLTDSMIERMLVERAGTETPADLTQDILRDAAAVRQNRRTPFLPALPDRRTQVLLAAAVLGLLVLATALALTGASRFFRVQHLVVAPTPSATAPATATPVATRLPTSSSAARPTSGGGGIALYARNAAQDRVLTLDLASGAEVQLATFPVPGRSWGRVQWSDDRTHLAVYETGDSPRLVAQIDVAARTVKTISLPIGGSDDAVSPSGNLVAQIDDTAKATIRISGLDGKGVKRLSLPAGVTVNGRIYWAPDSSAVLVAGCRPCNLLGKGPASSTDSHLYVMPLDGSPVRVLLSSKTAQFGSPTLSPDLRTILFTCDQRCPGIQAVSNTGGRATALTKNEADIQATWSPDGRQMAFLRSFGTGRGIWVMDADGANLTRLTTAALDYGETTPVWSPDGQSILFSKGVLAEGVLGDLWLVPASGGPPTLIRENAVGDW